MENIFSKKNMLIFIPATILGLFINWTMYVSRIHFDGNYLYGFNSIFSNPSVLIGALPLSFHRFEIMAFLIVTSAASFFLYQRQRNRKVYRSGAEYGSARWGTKEDIKKFVNPNYSENIILSKTEFLSMETRMKDWESERNKNTLIVGGAGSGKTRNIIKPNIMQMHSNYIVTDPKGLIARQLGHMLEKNGYNILIFNLVEFSRSLKYNPLKYINRTSDVLKLVETLITNTDGDNKSAQGENKFFVDAEKLLYQALIAAIIYDFPKKERNLPSMVELLTMMEVRENDDTFKNRVDLWFDELREEQSKCKITDDITPKTKKRVQFLGYAIRQYDSYKLSAGKTAKNILISCAARLSALNEPEFAELLSEDELNLDIFASKKGRTILFIIIPDTNKTYNFAASMLYSQLFNRLCTIADTKHGGTLPIPLRCILDEFANLGKIPNWEILIATIRERGISAMMVLQTKAQLKAMYDKNSETIIGNCDSEVYLGGKERSTIKEISESLGKQTISDFNTSDSRGTNRSASINNSKLGRELFSQDELITMPRRKCIVQISGLQPFYSDKYNIQNHPMYYLHADNENDKKWFDVEDYLKRSRERKINNKFLSLASIEAFNKKTTKAKKTRVNENPLKILFEGDEVYAETELDS
ncbi:MAG: type IV secretory system conjugative DNA transfer family protein [Defluviitaleaceae bacterium]|nr:type IV secretory system conjugative DNA transfer family protein [Defluviitaleaceae bacterium]